MKPLGTSQILPRPFSLGQVIQPGATNVPGRVVLPHAQAGRDNPDAFLSSSTIRPLSLAVPGLCYEHRAARENTSTLLLPPNEVTPNSEPLSYALCFFIKG